MSTVLAQIDTNSGFGKLVVVSPGSQPGYGVSVRARLSVCADARIRIQNDRFGNRPRPYGGVIRLRSNQRALSAIALSATAADFDLVGPHRLRACKHRSATPVLLHGHAAGNH